MLFSNSTSQESAIEELAETLSPVVMRPFDMPRTSPSRLTSGIYVFLRTAKFQPVRLYLGYSDRLYERVWEQRFLRRWATRALLFDTEDSLSTNTLLTLEKALLRHGYSAFRGAFWDNEKDLGGSQSIELFSGSQSKLPDLTTMIIEHVRKMIPRRVAALKHPHLEQTHSLHDPENHVEGKGCVRGGCTYLLPGSRISSRIPTFRMMKADPRACGTLSKYYWEGTIAWHRRSRIRPAGFAITEPIRFKTKAAASEFMFAGGTVTAQWEKL